jgi:hypothetical protein
MENTITSNIIRERLEKNKKEIYKIYYENEKIKDAYEQSKNINNQKPQ